MKVYVKSNRNGETRRYNPGVTYLSSRFRSLHFSERVPVCRSGRVAAPSLGSESEGAGGGFDPGTGGGVPGVHPTLGSTGTDPQPGAGTVPFLPVPAGLMVSYGSSVPSPTRPSALSFRSVSAPASSVPFGVRRCPNRDEPPAGRGG